MLIRRYLQAGVMVGGVKVRTDEGTPQGGPLSPLLANVLLDDLDKELERRGHRFVRYTDDCNIYVRSERAGHRVLAGVRRFLEQRLRLKVNEQKSAVDRPWRRKFLGFSMYHRRDGVRLRVAQRQDRSKLTKHGCFRSRGAGHVLATIDLFRRNPNIAKLVLAETISYVGDSIFDIVILWEIYEQTRSTFGTAALMIGEVVAQLTLGPILGAVADRFDRKMIMQVSAIVQMLLTALMALWSFWDDLPVWAIYVFSFTLSVFQLAYSPARSAILPEITDPNILLRVNALCNSLGQVASVVGASIGGILAVEVGNALAIAVDSATFAAAAFLIGQMQYQSLRISSEMATEGSKKPGKLALLSYLLRDMRKSLGFLLGNVIILHIIVLGTVSNIALAPINVLVPMLMADSFGGDARHLGFFESGVGLGMFLAGSSMSMVKLTRIGVVFAMGFCIQAVALGLIALASVAWLAVFGGMLLGVGFVATIVPFGTLVQTLVPVEMVGRVRAISSTLSSAIIPISYFCFAVLGDMVGPKLPLLMGAVLMASCGAIALCAHTIRAVSLDHNVLGL